MRKISGILITMVVLCSLLSTTVYAAQSQQQIRVSTIADVSNGNSLPGNTPETVSLTNDNLAMPLPEIRPNIPKNIIKPNSTIYNVRMNVPYYCQLDSRWSSDIMQTAGYTIGYAGCLLTDCAAIDYYFGQTSSTPKWLNVQLGNNACPLVWNALLNLPGGNIKHISYNAYNPDQTTLFNALTFGMSYSQPALFSYRQDSGSSHWLLVMACYGDGTHLSDYGCINPLDGQYHNLYDVVGSRQILQVAVLTNF